MTIPENRLSQELGFGDPGLISRRILTGRLELSGVVSALRDANERMLAYEMALRFCESDGALSEGEKEFLGDLQAHLRLNAAEAPNHTTVLPTYPLVPANNPYLVASHPLPPANPRKG